MTSPAPRTLAALLLSFGLGASHSLAQSSDDGLWTIVSQPTAARAAAPESTTAPAVQRLNHAVLEGILSAAPDEGGIARGEEVRLSVPTPSGGYLVFRIERSPVMAPALASQHPEIETFRGQGADGPAASVRFARTPLGFHATVRDGSGVFFVAPQARADTSLYLATRADGPLDTLFECLTGAFAPSALALTPDQVALAGFAPSGPELRQYRLAVAATGEYTQFFGSQALALAAIATTVNAINAVYEVEVAVRLMLIADNDDIVYDDPDTDPFPLADKNAETQAEIDSTIGDLGYDIGHLFHRAGTSISGNAGCIACVCLSGDKGSGWSQGPTPNDGNFIFVAAHEMGHQFGGTHTFNGTGCNASQYTATSAWEPGSGSTIMSYSSICGSDNVLGSQVGDLYFHAGSRQQITTYTQSGSGDSCAATSATGNSTPMVGAGSDYTIPQQTPFVLTATGSDLDGDPLSYTWEQFDLGPTAALSGVDDGQIPLFRSFPPSSNPARTLPLFQDLLDGSSSLFPNKLGEQLPSTDRTLTFRTTARDNRMGGGGADDDEMVITVSGAPFAITAPVAGGGLECNAPSDITWSVGGGSVAATVDVSLSTDGGASFPLLLAAGTANDGADTVAGPDTLTTDARLRIDSVGNIFFALSPQIAVQDTLDPVVVCPAPVVAECTGMNGVARTDPQLATFFAGASASDLCDPSVVPVDDAPPLIPLGVNPITFSGSDDSGNSGSCSANVTVVDTTPPTISVSLTPDSMFPPNHKLFEVTATVMVHDVCDPDPTVTLTSITSNEPDDGVGDGNTTGDIQGAAFGTADYSFFLRAERSGRGSGRVYTVTYSVMDGSGEMASASATVTIPKNASGK